MKSDPKAKFQDYERLFWTVSWVFLLVSLFFNVSGTLSVQAIQEPPAFMGVLAEWILYGYLGYFVFLSVRVIHYFVRIRPMGLGLSARYSLLGLVMAPVGIVLLYVAILLLTLASCSA